MIYKHWRSTCRRMRLHTYVISYTKINQMDQRPINVRAKTWTPLEAKIEQLRNIGFSKFSKLQNQKHKPPTKPGKLDLIKTVKVQYTKSKGATHGIEENIWKSHIWSGIMIQMYKEFIYPTVVKWTDSRRMWTDVFPKTEGRQAEEKTPSITAHYRNIKITTSHHFLFIKMRLLWCEPVTLPNTPGNLFLMARH